MDDPLIFPDGDVKVLYTSNGVQSHIMASSHALMMASPVWKKLLFPLWEVDSMVGTVTTSADTSEGHSSSGLAGAITTSENNIASPQNMMQIANIKQIDCINDNYSALLILLKIAHLEFWGVPTRLKFDTLYQVAILVDQYQCISLVRPWLKDWLDIHGFDLNSLPMSMLFVAWVFGMRILFESLAYLAVDRIEFSEGRWCWNTGGGGDDDDDDDEDSCLVPIPEPMPYGIIESIINERSKAIQMLLDIPYEVLSKYEIAETAGARICSQPHGSRECDALIHGSLIRGLLKIQLWPRKEVADVHISARMLERNIQRLDILRFQGEGPYCGSNHSSCGIESIMEKASRVLSGIGDPVLDSHHEHMRRQCEGK